MSDSASNLDNRKIDNHIKRDWIFRELSRKRDAKLEKIKSDYNRHQRASNIRTLSGFFAIILIGLIGAIFAPKWIATSAMVAQVQSSNQTLMREIRNHEVLNSALNSQNAEVALQSIQSDEILKPFQDLGYQNVHLFDDSGRHIWGNRNDIHAKTSFDFSTAHADSLIQVQSLPIFQEGVSENANLNSERKWTAQTLIPMTSSQGETIFIFAQTDIDGQFNWYTDKISIIIGLLCAFGFLVFSIYWWMEKRAHKNLFEEKCASTVQNHRITYEANARLLETKLLGELSEWLQSSNSITEFFQILRQFMITLFPNRMGAIYLHGETPRHLHLYCQWNVNDPSSLADRIHSHNCWGIRRGRLYEHGTQAVSLKCLHAVCEEDAYYFCIPIIANGEPLGLLHIAHLKPHERESEIITRDKELALLCIEQISSTLSNITLRERLEQQTLRDPLTGIFNRRAFHKEIDNLILKSRHKGTPFTLAELDVDHFKSFNDNYGHNAGDTALIAVAENLKKIDIGKCFRVGGEEFAIIIDDPDEDSVRAKLERARLSLTKLNLHQGSVQLPKLSASFGAAEFSNSIKDGEDLYRLADQALYAAKEGGRNRVVMYKDIAPSPVAASHKKSEPKSKIDIVFDKEAPLANGASLSKDVPSVIKKPKPTALETTK